MVIDQGPQAMVNNIYQTRGKTCKQYTLHDVMQIFSIAFSVEKAALCFQCILKSSTEQTDLCM